MGNTTLRKFRTRIGFACIATIVAAQIAACGRAAAEDRLRAEAVNFTGTLTFLSTKVPGFLLVAVRGSEMALDGFRKISDQGDKAPDADTMFRIGSVSKVFCGEVLASMVLDGKVRFADRLQDRLGYDVTLPEKAGHAIRLIDLVTHPSGMPPEVPRPDGPPNDPFHPNTTTPPLPPPQTAPPLFPPRPPPAHS